MVDQRGAGEPPAAPPQRPLPGSRQQARGQTTHQVLPGPQRSAQQLHRHRDGRHRQPDQHGVGLHPQPAFLDDLDRVARALAHHRPERWRQAGTSRQVGHGHSAGRSNRWRGRPEAQEQRFTVGGQRPAERRLAIADARRGRIHLPRQSPDHLDGLARLDARFAHPAHGPLVPQPAIRLAIQQAQPVPAGGLTGHHPHAAAVLQAQVEVVRGEAAFHRAAAPFPQLVPGNHGGDAAELGPRHRRSLDDALHPHRAGTAPAGPLPRTPATCEIESRPRRPAAAAGSTSGRRPAPPGTPAARPRSPRWPAPPRSPPRTPGRRSWWPATTLRLSNQSPPWDLV